ncbi:Ribosomal RNA small subunit methyltransferase E [Fundidesulfovibrio magnetotacticus]|uniref:Ribosomal RNA small subunit methyltransferase E n=1 Tax=Fundidesulfovibrio magnetotacticus TaxID=2730080 RepID=A0A6V8LTS8_9BACT|nr:16S rRNA (uracil(1498)-N(3))-methyltransferase [Fundidesulfovibrio magnetotacticus]GFK94340.1 Ribosomal RNA small subunit methyltransferase E [Fundidesulfovibrio magnetotacticus]
MARLDTFHIPPEAWGAPFRLEGDEARHLAKVLRLGPGARVRCFDGAGREGLFRVVCVRGGVELEQESEQYSAPSGGAWLALGWNKSARRGWLLEKAVELGCGGILFWEASRSQGGMPAEPKESWRAQLVAGAKQCGSVWLPELEMVSGGASGLAERCGAIEGKYLAWESRGVSRGLGLEDLTGHGGRVFVIGPEGGLTDPEADVLRNAGFRAVTLGPRPLRWETASLLCLGLAWWATSSGGPSTGGMR